jgi:HSP20 family protein
MVATYTLTPFTELRRQLNQLFDDFGFGRWRAPLTAVYPLVNVWDDGDALRLEAELPGIKQGDLEIFALGNELTIKGRWQPSVGDGQTRHRQERPSGEFSRVITLPFEVNADKVEARLKDGVLSVRLPKAESAKPRKITLKS